MRFTILLLGALIGQLKGATLDNSIVGDPEVECTSDSVLVSFNTAEAFEGHVYVKGHYDDATCRTDATLSRAASLAIPFESTCDVRRQRSANPRGLFVSVTVVITFHPMFITMVDRAYNVQCFYMESDKTVSAGFEVSLRADQHQQIIVMIGGKKGDVLGSLTDPRNVTPHDLDMLTTEVITQNIPMPTCTYEVLRDGPEGEPILFATIGDAVYHKWSCEGGNDDGSARGIFCMTVHSCSVENGAGRNVQIIDENGCATDRFIIQNVDYATDLTGGQSSMVFKFADQPSLFFKCQIRLTLKEGDTCTRSSDQCPDPSRGKRSAAWTDETPAEEVDVYSESITVFDIDDALSARLDASDVSELNRRAQTAGGLARTASSRAQGDLCLSAVTFGALIAVLVSVLLMSLVTVAIVCCRSSPRDRVHILKG